MDELDEYLLSRRNLSKEQPEGSSEEQPEGSNEEQPEGSSEEQQEGSSEEQPEVNIEKLPIEKKLAIISQLLGKEFTNEIEIQSFKDKYNTLETNQKYIELIPKLVEKIKTSQNILSYFPDEIAYKVVQLSKQEEYKGKEAVINKVLHSNINELSSLEVIELASKLDAPNNIRNPFRVKLLNLGLDPDLVTENYDSLSDDDKDRIDYLAVSERRILTKLGSDIQIPTTHEMDVLAEYEAELMSSKDDVTAKKNSIAPISKALVGELKELEITDSFKFKLDLTNDERKEYEEFITNAVLSGEYDLNTEKGKSEMWEAIKDLVFINNRKKITIAHEKFIREDEVNKIRQKHNNSQPINKNEPVVEQKTDSGLSYKASVAMGMI